MKTSVWLLKAIVPSEIFLVVMFKVKDWFPAFPIEGFFPFIAIALIICIIGLPVALLAMLNND